MIVISVFAVRVPAMSIQCNAIAIHGTEGGFILSIEGDSIVSEAYNRGMGATRSIAAVGVVAKVIKVYPISIKSVPIGMVMEGSSLAHMRSG